ncbi:MAG: hypothetical protein EBS38_02460 [Actinobacteria bacterium]|nr:hypothetical protein [Actinomycetota bacterium]
MSKLPLRSSSGSTLLELVIWVSLLLLPIGGGLALYGQLSDQLAAESIARNALRFAVLSADSNAEVRSLSYRQAEHLAQSWGKRISQIRMYCSGNCPRGNLLHLEVVIGNARATQTSALSSR